MGGPVYLFMVEEEQARQKGEGHLKISNEISHGTVPEINNHYLQLVVCHRPTTLFVACGM